MILKDFVLDLMTLFIMMSDCDPTKAASDKSSKSKRWIFGSSPEFDPENPQNVTAQLGGTAHLPCKIKNLGNKSVSWIRSRDSHILTVDRYAFISDDRFSAWHDRATRSWTLKISYVQPRDAGRYECQVSTEPKMSHFMQLNIIEPRVDMGDAEEVYVRSGSTVVINCTIHNSIDMPEYFFWYHNKKRIIGSDENHDIKVQHDPPEKTIVSYVISRADSSDSGEYICEPTGLKSDSLIVHVLPGEEPAAMQHGSDSSAASKDLEFAFLSMSLLAVWFNSPLTALI